VARREASGPDQVEVVAGYADQDAGDERDDSAEAGISG
jgi:hypothetical protein